MKVGNISSFQAINSIRAQLTDTIISLASKSCAVNNQKGHEGEAKVEDDNNDGDDVE